MAQASLSDGLTAVTPKRHPAYPDYRQNPSLALSPEHSGSQRGVFCFYAHFFIVTAKLLVYIDINYTPPHFFRFTPDFALANLNDFISSGIGIDPSGSVPNQEDADG